MAQHERGTAYYHLPGLFEFYELYRVFLPLFREHREYFYDWCEIGSVYGAPADCIWGGGRAGFGDAQPHRVLALMQEYGISARLTFSNSLLREEHLTDPKCNALCAQFAQGSVQNGVIVHSDLLVDYLQEYYPELYLVSSTTKVLTEFAQLEAETARPEFRYVVPDFRLNKALAQLDSLPQPQNIKFTSNKKYAVYSGPGENYFRGGNGKAAVSTNDWIQVFGRENGWIMLQYDITSDHMRIGWIQESALPKNANVSDVQFSQAKVWTKVSSNLTDDPLFSAAAISAIPANTEVTRLATMGTWTYVEWNAANAQPMRGFVQSANLTNLSADDVQAIAVRTLLASGFNAVEQEASYSCLYDPETARWSVVVYVQHKYQTVVWVDDATGEGTIG